MALNGDLVFMNQARWLTLMSSFGFKDNGLFFNDLSLAYNEKHRRYHTADHIDATLKHFDAVAHLFEKPEQAELALWFHDVIYKPFSSTNERDSARYASDFLQANGAQQAVINNVYELIMATEHTAIASSSDEALLVDIDLSILGARPEVYNQFEKDIRFEYKRVPYFLYKSKRKEVLMSFLNRKTIYQNNFFIDKFEKQARENLHDAINLL